MEEAVHTKHGHLTARVQVPSDLYEFYLNAVLYEFFKNSFSEK
jgi:hypothetical protein